MADNGYLLHTDIPTKQSQIGDFVQAFGHTVFEAPVNGVTQIINHATGAKLPELELIGQPKDSSFGTTAGTIAGAAVDYYVMSRLGNAALGNLGGNGIAGNALRAGLVGGVYSGVFTPSDPNSQSFFTDRLQNAAIGGATFASMSASMQALNRSGLFVVPEVRSLGASMGVGGLSGLAGGITHAEASAILKGGSLIPEGSSLLKDGITYSAFGAAFGALDYGYYHSSLGAPKVTEVSSQGQNEISKDATPARIKLYQNSQGDVVKIESDLPSRTSSYSRVGIVSTKMGDGTWSGKGYDIMDGKWWSDLDGHVVVPKIQDVKVDIDGSIKVISADGDIRSFTPNGSYSRTNPQAEAKAAADKISRDAEYAKIHEKSLDYVDWKGDRKVTFENNGTGEAAKGSSMISMKGDVVESVSFNQKNNMFSDYTSMKRTGPDTWSVTTKSAEGTPLEYSWKGDVKAITGEGGKIASFELKPATGSEFSLTRQPDSTVGAYKALMSSAKLEGFNPEWRYIRMDAEGNIFIKPGSGNVNGNAGGMKEFAIKPGDNVSVSFDIGDRAPNFQSFPITWTKALDGTLLFNGNPLKPNTAIGLSILTKDVETTF